MYTKIISILLFSIVFLSIIQLGLSTLNEKKENINPDTPVDQNVKSTVNFENPPKLLTPINVVISSQSTNATTKVMHNTNSSKQVKDISENNITTQLSNKSSGKKNESKIITKKQIKESTIQKSTLPDEENSQKNENTKNKSDENNKEIDLSKEPDSVKSVVTTSKKPEDIKISDDASKLDKTVGFETSHDSQKSNERSLVPDYSEDGNSSSSSSSRFMMIIFFGLLFTILAYVCFQKRKKIMAYVLEGRRKTTRTRNTSSNKDIKVSYKPLESEDKEAGASNYKYVY